jgi:protein-tyrosine-phosphatase
VRLSAPSGAQQVNVIGSVVVVGVGIACSFIEGRRCERMPPYIDDCQCDARVARTADAKEPPVTDTPEVLFVCVHNAGRSQMAAALLDHHANGKVLVRSAGSEPADRLNPAVVAAMAELGIDLSREFPKPLTDQAVRAADVVITMGCGDACPIYPGRRYEDWQLQDPAGQPVEVVRGIRDQIDARVQQLLAELVLAPG